MEELEKALCSAEGLGTLERSKLGTKKKARKNRNERDTATGSHSGSHNDDGGIGAGSATARRPHSVNVERSSMVSASETVSPPPLSSQHQRRHSYSLDSRQSTSTVFEPLPSLDTSEEEVPVSSGAVGMIQEDAVIEEVEPFPNLGVNQPVDNELPITQLPASSPTQHSTQDLSTPPSTSISPSTAPGHLVSDKAKGKDGKPSRRARQRGPAGFPSVEDLMHRLFLGISGVADQLQTNHAKDLRMILKDVFAVCQNSDMEETEEEENVDGVQNRSRDNNPQSKYLSVEDRDSPPCSSPAPQSPLITASQGKYPMLLAT